MEEEWNLFEINTFKTLTDFKINNKEGRRNCEEKKNQYGLYRYRHDAAGQRYLHSVIFYIYVVAYIWFGFAYA